MEDKLKEIESLEKATEDFIEVADILSTIQQTGSTLQKQAMLKKYEDNNLLKQILKWLYDPYTISGIGSKKLDNYYQNIVSGIVRPMEMIRYLKDHHTGDTYDVATAYNFVAYWEDEDANAGWLARAIVTKDLQIGVKFTTLNKVFGEGFIPTIGIMRGTLAPTNFTGVYLATEKIDGNRRLIMNKDTGVEIYTRSGRRDNGLVEIEEQAAHLPKGYVYDCECVAIGDFEDSIELRQASASILNRRNSKRTGVKALCFDMLPQRDYDSGKSVFGALARKTILAATMGDLESVEVIQRYCVELDERNKGKTNFANSVNALQGLHRPPVKLDNIQPLPILGFVHNYDEAIALATPIWETGGEGLMLVDYRSPYEVNPNPRKTLLKIKATEEFKLKCVNVFEGKNKYEGMLGGITLEYKASDGKVYYVDCGSGFPDYLRAEYWNNPEKVIGKTVEIESFGESKNAQGFYSLNCTIFKRIVGEKE